MKYWNSKVKLFLLQVNEVSSWPQTMIAEYENREKEEMIPFYLPKRALRIQRQVLKVKAFDFQALRLRGHKNFLAKIWDLLT